MKKVLLIVVSTLVVLVAGLWIYVANIDWNRHKDKISAQLLALTGKKVVFEGPVEMSILPSPYLTASDVKVYNESGDYSQKPLAEIKSLIAKVSLGAVFGEEWDVSRLSVVEPEIVIDIADDGSLNWQTEAAPRSFEEQRNTSISLDSATLEKAKVHLIDARNGIDTRLENLNAEVIAENIYGPYRIEGSYMRGDKPEGFAVSLGQFTDNFATTVNLVVNYPSLESYVRFDGSVFLRDRTVTGNIIFESSKIADFLNEMTALDGVDASFNQPLAVTAAVATDKDRIDFSNVVVKYGRTSGAGNVLIPLQQGDGAERRKVEAAFNMTDWDLEPAAKLLLQVVDGYKKSGAAYSPDLGFDLLGDVKALKAYYNNETLRDFALSFDWVGKKVVLQELSGALWADTTFSCNGQFDGTADNPTYDVDVSFETGEFAQLSKWLGYELKQVAPSTYKKAKGTAHILGNLQNMQLSPFELALDNSAAKGEAGFIFGNPVKSMIVLNIDSANFDNYIEKLPQIDADKNLLQRIQARFKQLEALNGLDTRIILSMTLGIYNGLPFENVSSEFSLVNGVLNIGKLDIGSVSGSEVHLSGTIGGFGKSPVFQNLRYSLESNDAAALINTLGLEKEGLKPGMVKKFSAQGVASGNIARANVRTSTKVENLSVVYDGAVDYSGEMPSLNGSLELKNPDFVKFINNLGYSYKPRAFSLGLLQLKAKLAGSREKFSLAEAEMNIGSNRFQGSFDFDRSSGRPQVQTDMKINRFEIERFLPEDAGSASNRPGNFKDAVGAEFIAKPELSKVKINYAPFNEFDLSGSFVFDNLSYRDEKMSNVSFGLAMKEGLISLKDLSMAYNNGMVNGSAQLAAGAEPNLKGKLQLARQSISDGRLSGSKYGLRYGKLDGDVDFTTSAVSFDDMFNNLSGTFRFTISQPVVKGWNLPAIAADLEKRTQSEGVAAFVQDNMQKGEMQFESFGGSLVLNKGQYKLSDAVFVSPQASVLTTDEGSLTDWNMNGKFSVVWENLKDIPGFAFTMAGSLAAPQLSVDTGELVKSYDDRNARFEAERKAQEQARRDALKSDMNAQQERARGLKKKIEEDVGKRLAETNSLLRGEKAKNKSEQLQGRLDGNIQQIEKVFTLGLTPEYDEALIQSVREMNDAVEGQVNGFYDEIDVIYHDDVAEQIDFYYNMFEDIYKRAEALNGDYGEKYKSYPQRLVKISSKLILGNDCDVSRLKSGIENNLLALKGIRFDITKSYGVVKDSNDTPRMAAYAAELRDKADRAKTEFETMQANADSLYKVCEAKVSAEEEKDRRRKEEAAIKRKVEENTSTISVSGSGKVMRVVPDIEDVQKAEEAIQKEEVRVLDFSKEDDGHGVVRQDNAPRLKEKESRASGIITKASGEIVGATGTVTKQ